METKDELDWLRRYKSEPLRLRFRERESVVTCDRVGNQRC